MPHWLIHPHCTIFDTPFSRTFKTTRASTKLGVSLVFDVKREGIIETYNRNYMYLPSKPLLIDLETTYNRPFNIYQAFVHRNLNHYRSPLGLPGGNPRAAWTSAGAPPDSGTSWSHPMWLETSPVRWFSQRKKLPFIQKTMENHHFSWEHQL